MPIVTATSLKVRPISQGRGQENGDEDEHADAIQDAPLRVFHGRKAMAQVLAEHRPQEAGDCADDEERQRGILPQGVAAEDLFEGIAVEILLQDQAKRSRRMRQPER